MSPTDPEDWPERIEYEVNAQLGGDATVSQIVEIMLRLGWRPPDAPRPIPPAG